MKSQILLTNLNVKKRNFSRDEKKFHNFLSFDTWISIDFKTLRQALKRARFRGSLLPSQVHCTDYCSIFGRPAQVWPSLAGRRRRSRVQNETDPEMALRHQLYFLSKIMYAQFLMARHNVWSQNVTILYYRHLKFEPTVCSNYKCL